MNKHALWKIEESNYGDELWFGGSGCGLISVNGWVNGGCKKSPDLWAELQSEAQLIAAAPDMYALLAIRAESGDNEASELLRRINNG